MVTFERIGMQIIFNSSDNDELTAVKTILSPRADGYYHSKLYHKRDENGKRVWDGRIKLYKDNLFPYGLVSLVQQELAEQEIESKIIGDYAPLPIDLKKIRKDLHEHSKEAIAKFFQRPYGCIKFPTRGGKTYCAAEIFRLTKNIQILFVVDTDLLFNQAIEDFNKYYSGAEVIGQIKKKKFAIERITVASIQTMQAIVRNRQRNGAQYIALMKYLKNLGGLAVDEIQDSSSDDRYEIYKKCNNLKFGLFLSATPEKSEGNLVNLKIKRLMREVVYEVSPQVLKERGILAQEKILLVLIRAHKTEQKKYLDKEREFIIYNKERNFIVSTVINICNSLNLKTLVLFGKIDHANIIHGMTGHVLLTGLTPINSRIKECAAFLKKVGGILLATNIFNKGLTLPEVEVTLLAGGGLEQSQTVQKKGRSLGVTKTKKNALTVDFIDMNETFSSHTLNRIHVYEQHAGKQNIFVYDSSDEHFYTDIREFLNEWKN